MPFYVLAVNPGSTSTKIAMFADENQLWNETVRHANDELAPFDTIAAQFDFRLATIIAVLKEHPDAPTPNAVVGRGGIIDPLPGGTFNVDERLVKRLLLGRPWEHASNLGGVLANALASKWNVPAFIVDPVCVDEMVPEAKITGMPELPKPSFSHALNTKAVVRKAAQEAGVPWDSVNYVVVHLGGGVGVVAHRKGRIIDLNNANECGPMSPTRAGGLPVWSFVRMCFSEQFTKRDIKRRLSNCGGLMAHLGTGDTLEIRKMIDAGDKKAAFLYKTMAWQIAKEIGAQAVSMGEKVDAIIFTGGTAYDSEFVSWIEERVQWIAPCLVYPGENEMLAMTQGALRVLNGEEIAKNYGDYI